MKTAKEIINVVLQKWIIRKENELIIEGILGEEKRKRMRPSKATIDSIEEATLLGMKELLDAIEQDVQEAINKEHDKYNRIRHELQWDTCKRIQNNVRKVLSAYRKEFEK